MLLKSRSKAVIGSASHICSGGNLHDQYGLPHHLSSVVIESRDSRKPTTHRRSSRSNNSRRIRFRSLSQALAGVVMVCLVLGTIANMVKIMRMTDTHTTSRHLPEGNDKAASSSPSHFIHDKENNGDKAAIVAAKARQQQTLTKITMATTIRDFQVYEGFEVFLIDVAKYTFRGQTYTRKCRRWHTKCQVHDWMKLFEILLGSSTAASSASTNHGDESESAAPSPSHPDVEESLMVWILEDDTYPCPGAEPLIEEIMRHNDNIEFMNTGIGASGWVMRRPAMLKFLHLMNIVVEKKKMNDEKTMGVDINVAELYRPLPHRCAVNLVAHTRRRGSTFALNAQKRDFFTMFPSCYEYQSTSGWKDFDLFDWNDCAGKDVHPCSHSTSEILAQRQIGYVGNKFIESPSNHVLLTWMPPPSPQINNTAARIIQQQL